MRIGVRAWRAGSRRRAMRGGGPPVAIMASKPTVCLNGSHPLAQGGVLNFPQFLRAWLEVSECPLWTGAIAFRRELLMEAGLFPEGRAVRGGDKDLWLRAMRHTRLVYAPVITAEFNRDSLNKVSKIGRAHVCTQVTTAHLVCRSLLD